MTLVAIDWLVLHATIFQANVDRYRRKAVLKKPFVGGAPACVKTKLDLDCHSRDAGARRAPGPGICSLFRRYSAIVQPLSEVL